MKRFLAMSFLLVSTAVTAQSQRPSEGCSVLIGRNWIPMSAASVNGCFKFAEAAATPGERQIAAFGATSLAYQSGQYFLSNDGGKSWVNAYPRQAQTVMSSLNKLPSSNDVTATKAGNNVSVLVQEPPSMPAPLPVPESVPVPVQQNASVSQPVGASQSAPVADVAPIPQVLPAQPAAAASVATAAPTVILKVCQLKDADEKWHRYLTATINECGAKLTDITVKSGAKSGQAYWNSQYVFYSGGLVYQSADGDRWQPVE